MTNIVTLDDGSVFSNPRYTEQNRVSLEDAHTRLNRKAHGSSARRKAKRHLRSVYRKIANRRLTHRHTIAKRLIQKADILVFEDLDPRQLRLYNERQAALGLKSGFQTKGLQRLLDDASLRKLITEVGRKIERRGGSIIMVDPAHTSAECSNCGTRSAKTTYDVHECPACGIILHRDHNAALVIKSRGLALLDQQSSNTSRCVLDGKGETDYKNPPSFIQKRRGDGIDHRTVPHSRSMNAEYRHPSPSALNRSDQRSRMPLVAAVEKKHLPRQMP